MLMNQNICFEDNQTVFSTIIIVTMVTSLKSRGQRLAIDNLINCTHNDKTLPLIENYASSGKADNTNFQEKVI